MQFMFTSEHLSVQNIDLQIPDTQARHELTDLAVSSAQHRARAGHEIIWNEGNADVVVSPALECIQLPPQIAAPGQRDHADRASGARVVDELDRRTGLEVNVKEEKMRLPLRDRGSGRFHRRFGPADIAAMPEGEVDGVR